MRSMKGSNMEINMFRQFSAYDAPRVSMNLCEILKIELELLITTNSIVFPFGDPYLSTVGSLASTG